MFSFLIEVQRFNIQLFNLKYNILDYINNNLFFFFILFNLYIFSPFFLKKRYFLTLLIYYIGYTN
jgi:hypothetical protein